MNPQTERTCVRCKETKNTKENFNKYTNGQAKRSCKLCEAETSSDKLRCRTCKERKLKSQFNTASGTGRTQKCDDCKKVRKERKKATVKPKMPKVTTKKTKEVEKHRVGSYEEAHTIKLTAKEVLEKAKKIEADLMRGGARYVKGNGVRMYVLSK